MSPRSLFASACACAAAAWIGTAPARAQGRTYTLASVGAATLERAREGAARRLDLPECQRLLVDFADESGRPLAQNLARFDRSASDYLRMIPFLDGASRRPCRDGRAELFAVPGVPRVFVCPSFAEKQIRDPWTAESMVIHEMLHTLGLGENPPSSAEITRRVNSRCQ